MNFGRLRPQSHVLIGSGGLVREIRNIAFDIGYGCATSFSAMSVKRSKTTSAPPRGLTALTRPCAVLLHWKVFSQARNSWKANLIL